jgi:hypothetical protein
LAQKEREKRVQLQQHKQEKEEKNELKEETRKLSERNVKWQTESVQQQQGRAELPDDTSGRNEIFGSLVTPVDRHFLCRSLHSSLRWRQKKIF